MAFLKHNRRTLGLIGMLSMLVSAEGLASGLRVGWVDIHRIDQEISETGAIINSESSEWAERAKKIKEEHDATTVHQQEFDSHQAQWSVAERQEKQKKLDLDLANYQDDLRVLREDEALKIHQAQLNLYQQVKEIIKHIAIQEHIDIVVSDVWYINPQYDLTTQVLHQLTAHPKP